MSFAYDDRYQTSTPVTSTSVFTIDFPIFSLTSDVEVYIDEVLTEAYAITGTAVNGVFTDATLTLTTAIVNQTIEIIGARNPRRDDDLVNGSDFVTNLNAELNAHSAERQENFRDFKRTMRFPYGTAETVGALPNATDRASKFLGFDALGAISLSTSIPQGGLAGTVPVSDYGSDHSAINSAIDYMNSLGGGNVVVTGDMTISGQVVGKDKVCLDLLGHTLTLDTDLTASPFVYASDAPGFQIKNGKLVVDGNTTGYAIEIEGASNYPIDNIEITEHKAGVRIEANATSGIGNVVVRDLYVHDNFVHPTSPATLSQAGHALSISCRPSQGYDLTEKVTLDNIRLVGVAQGATDGSNQYTKDLCTIQGAKRVIIDGIQCIDSGEVGCSISFGCRDVDIHNAVVTGADGNGIYASGSHWRLDVTSVSGTFQVGEDVTGGTSGASAEIEYLPAAGIIWVYDSAGTYSQFTVGETITGGTSGATATISLNNYMRDIRVHPSCRTENCGIDAASTGATLAGLQAARGRDIGLGGHHKDSPIGVRVARSTGFEAGHLTYDGNTTDFSAVSTQWIAREQELILDTAADPSEQLANVRRYRYKVQTAATSTATPWSYTLTNDEILAVRVKVIWSNTSYANNGYQVIDALFKKDGASAAAQVGSTVETVNIETTASAGAELNLTTSTIELDLVSVSGSAVDWFVEIETMTFADAIE